MNNCYFCLSEKHSAQQPFFVLCLALIFWSFVGPYNFDFAFIISFYNNNCRVLGGYGVQRHF
jgi:hypothetical protein